MKIGLLTYHYSANIGAVMQAYATCRALQELGHEVVIVDIRQPEDNHSGLVKLIADVANFKRDRDLRKFRSMHYPPLTRRYLSVDSLRLDPPRVDCLLVGSDQTWNLDISKEMAMAYFLDFGDERIRRMSYASSFGRDSWPENSPVTKGVQKALTRFQHLSVREATGLDILAHTFGLDGTLVVDPTMLFADYQELTGPIPEKNELVCYKLERNQAFYTGIEAVKQMAGMPARLLNNSYPVKGFRYTCPPGVSEWIRRLGGARMVLTDSFHGTVFSLLYQRNFVAVMNKNGRDSRILDLLKAVGLQSRAFESMETLKEDPSWLQPVDYSVVEPRLRAMREVSWDYLKRALQ